MAFLRRFLFGRYVLIALAVYLALAVVTARHGDRELYPVRQGGVTIYVLNNGFHTDIALPADQVTAHGGALAAAGRMAGGGRWLIYGWGDAGFFAGHGPILSRAGDGLRALFHPNNPSVIRVFGVNTQPDQAFVGTAPVVLSQAGLDALEDHMQASFTQANGAPVVAPLASNEGAFFKSTEHFSIVRVCNNWTADQLSAAGLPTAPMVDGLGPILALDLQWRSGVRVKPRT